MSFLKSFFHFTEGVIDLPININVPLRTEKPVNILHNFVYDANFPDICRMDAVFLPNLPSYPVLLYIHGGGFVAGDKNKRRGITRWFASLGYFVLNVNYGLCPEFSYPEPVRHLTSALNWIAEQAVHYSLDLDRVAVAGDSAGAYYAAELAALSTNSTLAEALGTEPKVKINAAVLNCGIYNIEAALKQKIIFDVNAQIFESFTGIKDEAFKSYPYHDTCSPSLYITPEFPPTLLLYAKRDLFCGGQSELMIDALQKAGVYHEEYHTNDLLNNHCFSLQWINRKAREANTIMESFLDDFAVGTLSKRVPHQFSEMPRPHKLSSAKTTTPLRVKRYPNRERTATTKTRLRPIEGKNDTTDAAEDVQSQSLDNYKKTRETPLPKTKKPESAANDKTLNTAKTTYRKNTPPEGKKV